MELFSPLLSRDICRLIVRFSSNYHFLHIYPLNMFFGETLVFKFLGFLKIHEKNTNKEIQKEEGAYQDKANEVVGVLWGVI